MTPSPGGLPLVDRDDLHAGGLGVPLQVCNLACRALAFPGRRDAGVYYGFASQIELELRNHFFELTEILVVTISIFRSDRSEEAYLIRIF